MKEVRIVEDTGVGIVEGLVKKDEVKKKDGEDRKKKLRAGESGDGKTGEHGE